MVGTTPDIHMEIPENGHLPFHGNTDSFGSEPNLVEAAPLKVRVSVIKLLGAARYDNLFRKLDDRALRKIERLADLFEAAQAFEAAYKLRRLVLL